eukprot:6492700-Amphidinium_carterae.1
MVLEPGKFFDDLTTGYLMKLSKKDSLTSMMISYGCTTTASMGLPGRRFKGRSIRKGSGKGRKGKKGSGRANKKAITLDCVGGWVISFSPRQS